MSVTRAFQVLLFCFLSLGALAQADLPDSTRVEWRSLSEDTLEELRSDEELLYPTEASQSVSWWTRLLAVIAAVIDWVMRMLGMTNSSTFMNIIYFICTVLFIWLVWRLFLSKYDWIFGGSSRRTNKDYLVTTENIHEIDYDKQIEEALASNDFRLAVRLLYLRTLKLLSDAEVIHYAEGKTNREYVNEVINTPYSREFVELSYHFNYLWYGHFEAGKHNWESAEDEFMKIREGIRSK